ncbi:MAG: 4-hydroxythreonine-4-phosphate dehydrogenase PdxA [Candidatus Kapaibacterium sp.]
MKIIVTIGDPNGIGIEVMIKALEKFYSDQDNSAIETVIAGNSEIIRKYIYMLGLPIEVVNSSVTIAGKRIRIEDCVPPMDIDPGRPAKSAGAAARAAIEYAVDHTIAGDHDAMVTMPVSKEVLKLAGWKYPGHTEMLAARCGVKNPLMVLMTRHVRVALATIHMAIREIPYSISVHSIVKLAGRFNACLACDFGIERPRIAALGLNPHAGEGGNMGREELDTIIPAIERLRLRGVDIDGPHPADGFFAHGAYKNYDGILAMYHDQGLIPLKMIALGAGVNYTAGLPIVRTSPDHGTAFGIAGKNLADCASSYEALTMARDIARNRTKA